MHYYPFMVKLDRYNGSCNILDDPYRKKKKFSFLFSMITRGNESKILKYISCKCNFQENIMCTKKITFGYLESYCVCF